MKTREEKYVDLIHTKLKFDWLPWFHHVERATDHADLTTELNNSTIGTKDLDAFGKALESACSQQITEETALEDIDPIFEKLIDIRNDYAHVMLNPADNIYFNFVINLNGKDKYVHVSGITVWDHLIKLIMCIVQIILYRENKYVPYTADAYHKRLNKIKHNMKFLLNVAQNMKFTISMSCNLVEASIYTHKDKCN